MRLHVVLLFVHNRGSTPRIYQDVPSGQQLIDREED
jgi:hypothetical protein